MNAAAPTPSPGPSVTAQPGTARPVTSQLRVRRTALVTGASSGIGRASALQLAAEGWDLVLVSRSLEVLETVAAECTERGARALPVVADVRDEAAVESAFETARNELGSLDAVVHSAATLAYGRFEDVPSEVFRSALDTTLHGTVHVARATLEQFRRQGGRGSFVVVGSLLGKISTPFMSSYITAKWAVHGLVRTLQIEARTTPGIDISLVSPGGVDTPVYRQGGTYVGVHGQPPPPVVTPEHVAASVVHAIDHPSRDRGVGALNPLVVSGFRLLPGVFDRIVTPLMKIGGLSKERTGPTAGNVLDAVPALEAVRGGYTHASSSSPSPLALTPSDVESPAEHHTDDAHRISLVVRAPATAVWDVLDDGWTYCNWIVGTAQMRDVDMQWPAPGARLHHSVGIWPALISDTTEVLHRNDTSLVLEARGWPLGKAQVTIEVEPLDEHTSRVTMVEDAVAGPGMIVPSQARQLLIVPRNRESLQRLSQIVEGRWRESRRADSTSSASPL